MNYPIVIRVLGSLLIFESLGMIPSLLVSLYYGQNDSKAFILSILITGILGLIMYKTPTRIKRIKSREALSIVSVGWVLVSFFGALPLVLSGSVPSWFDAFFEMVSGFTTTGATVIGDVEALPQGILFWRSFSHWIGGMGILVFTVAILPAFGVGSFQIFKAESPGPTADRIVPRIKDTAKILYTVYFIVTIIQIVFLKIGGMSFYDSLVYTFGTVGTGGFATKNASVGAYHSSYVNYIISIFMILSGISFSLYYQMYKGRLREGIKNEELKLYLVIVSASVLLITLNIAKSNYGSLGKAFEHALFQVGSIITTTGYSTADFDQWPTFSKAILFLLMFVGGCAGSTAGGIKNIRILVLLKLIRREMAKIFHPRAIIHVKVNDRVLSGDVLASITSFFALYIIIFVLSTIVVSLEGVGLVSASSSVAATLNNVGPGFDFVGPTRNFGEYGNASKMLFSFLMLFGRLELFTMLMLFNPKFWTDEI